MARPLGNPFQIAESQSMETCDFHRDGMHFLWVKHERPAGPAIAAIAIRSVAHFKVIPVMPQPPFTGSSSFSQLPWPWKSPHFQTQLADCYGHVIITIWLPTWGVDAGTPVVPFTGGGINRQTWLGGHSIVNGLE